MSLSNKAPGILFFLMGSLMFVGCGKAKSTTSVTPPVIRDTLSFSGQVYASGDDGYNTYRIPAMIKTNKILPQIINKNITWKR